MPELARVLYHLEVHLLFASLVWASAWVICSTVRTSPTLCYWIWVATALNFVLPLGAMIDRMGARHLSWARPLGALGDAGTAVASSKGVAAVGVVWLAGALLMAARLVRRLAADHRGAAAPQASTFADGFPVEFGAHCPAPSVSGLLWPRITLPTGIDRLLDPGELDAVLLHELTHARRRDNLIRLVYEIGLCLVWFHPLLWLAGSRLALFRELSCDEAVVRESRGDALVSALAKLASPESGALLEAGASSFLRRRLASLADPALPPTRMANAAVAAAFVAALALGLFETVAHTACCFLGR